MSQQHPLEHRYEHGKLANRPEPPGLFQGEALSDDETGLSDLLNTKEGYIVGRMGNKLLRLNTDTHLITAAPPGSGKGKGSVIPNLLDHQGSAFVIDIRGETVAATAEARMLMGQNVVVLDPYDLTKGEWGRDSWNPLSSLDPRDRLRFQPNARRIAKALNYDPDERQGRSDAPIWDRSTQRMFESFITYLLCHEDPQYHNLTTLAHLYLMTPDEKSQLTDRLTEIYHQPGTLAAVKQLLAYLTDGAQETKIASNAIVSGQTALAWATDEAFIPMLSSSSFSIDRLQEEPTTIYLVIPQEYIEDCAVWVRLLLEFVFSSLKEVKDLFNVFSNELPQNKRVLFLLDEFPAFGKLDIVRRQTDVVRGRGANIWMIMQSINQLKSIYGDDAETIINNTALLQAFDAHAQKEVEYFSELIGVGLFEELTLQTGTSESKGRSHSKSKSRQITFQESVSEGSNTATTITEGENTGGSSTFNKGTSHTQSSQSSNQTSSSSGYSGKTSFLGHLLGLSEHSIIGWKQKNKGVSSGSSYSSGTSDGYNESWGRTENWGSSRSVAETQGQSTQRTTGQSNSEGDSESDTESWNSSENFSVSAKPVELKIAPPRKLRLLMGGDNQLLCLRGKNAFICPRMDFIAKDPETGLYRFPHLLIVSSKLSLSALWKQIRSVSQRTSRPRPPRGLPPSIDNLGALSVDAFFESTRYWRDLAIHLRNEFTIRNECITLFGQYLSRMANAANQPIILPPLPRPENQDEIDKWAARIYSLLLFDDGELAKKEEYSGSINSKPVLSRITDLYKKPLADLQSYLNYLAELSSEQDKIENTLSFLANKIDESIQDRLATEAMDNVVRRHNSL